VFAQSPSAEVAFEQLGSQHSASLGHNYLVRQEPGDHFRVISILNARPNHPSVEHLVRVFVQEVPVTNKRHVAAALPVDGVVGRDDRILFVAKDNPAGTEAFVT